MSARDVIADWIHFEASTQNGFENSRGKSVNDHADDILSALRSAGFAVVPVEPTLEMIAAWDRVARPGLHAFEARYKAMITAAQLSETKQSEDSRE